MKRAHGWNKRASTQLSAQKVGWILDQSHEEGQSVSRVSYEMSSLTELVLSFAARAKYDETLSQRVSSGL
jgi:hypothetical protein